MAPKRKSNGVAPSEADGKKKRNKLSYEEELREPHEFSKIAEDNGIVLRKYYPPEMSNTRARAYIEEDFRRPMEELVKAQRETADARKQTKTGDAVVHWFKTDLRCEDNTALSLASAKANEAGVPLICMYIVSPEDFEAHLRSPVRVDFILRTLKVLQDDLAKLDIPLYVETVHKRKEIPSHIVKLLDDWGANHVFANIEYEVDELRRETKLTRTLAAEKKAFETIHDTCVVPPGRLRTGTGNQYAVYTPWYRTWVKHIHENLELLELQNPPSDNPTYARSRFKSLFNGNIPEAPKGKQLTDEEKKRFHSLWPCGEHEAKRRLDKFCEERIGSYRDRRNIPTDNGTSCLSVHLASGTISARTCVRTARDSNTTKKLDGGNGGIITWISEVAWRDFYRHVLVRWPHIW
jgi:deoxyribodipyrimidine photo-lyase